MKYLAALLEIFNLLKAVFEMIMAARREGWIQDGKELAKAIKEAKTDDERRELVKRLASHSRNKP